MLADFLLSSPRNARRCAQADDAGARLDDQIMEETPASKDCRPMNAAARDAVSWRLPQRVRHQHRYAHVRGAERNSARNFESVVARCGRGGDAGGRYFPTSNTDQDAIRDRAIHALEREGHRGFGDVTVISDGAEILKRLPRAKPQPTANRSTGFTLL